MLKKCTDKRGVAVSKTMSLWFNKQALDIICSYLSDRKQGTKINNVLSS